VVQWASERSGEESGGDGMRIYKARYGYDYGIEWVEVDCVTEKSVFTRHGVQRRETEGLKFCDTFTEAKETVLRVICDEIEQAEQRLRELQQALERIEFSTPESIKETDRTY
jgi:hypothetical protein